ncbi:hypothetical protein BD309DRAFT_1014585 [Dichomitus squalens]|nr:hypothetical protein BD309DRAFT_1014585 [Dichomitus squalens]
MAKVPLITGASSGSDSAGLPCDVLIRGCKPISVRLVLYRSQPQQSAPAAAGQPVCNREKLDALEREEEKLEAEHFYDSESDVFDSDNEHEAVAAKAAHEKLISQSTKMTGLDLSRNQERAEMLAEVARAKWNRQCE